MPTTIRSTENPALVVVLWLLSATLAHGETSPAPRLQMVNGDYYGGQLLECNETGVVCWQSEVAVRPFLFSVGNIGAIHFPRKGEPLNPQGDYSLELLGGDLLYGSLEAISAESLELDTADLGRVKVDRSVVRRLQNVGKESSIEYLGPDGLQGWVPQGAKDIWREEAGHLLTDAAGSIELPTVAIPKQADIEIELSWQRRGDFSLRFGMPSEFQNLVKKVAVGVFRGLGGGGEERSDDQPESFPSFEVAVWGDSLTLVRELKDVADLASLARVFPGAGRMALRLRLDEPHGVVTAYTLEGKLLGRVQTAGTGTSANVGIGITNNSGDLRLERLLIRCWGKVPPLELTDEKINIQLFDGSSLAVDEVTYDGGSQQFVLTNESQQHSVYASDVACLTLPSQRTEPGEIPLRFSLRDGTRLSGHLEKVDNDQVYVRRAGIAEAVLVPIERVQSIVGLQRTAIERTAAGTLGRLKAANTSSRGMLVPATQSADGSQLAWLPLGSTKSSPLRRDLNGALIYRTPAPNPRPNPQKVAQARPQKHSWWDSFAKIFEGSATDAGNSRLVAYPELLWLQAGDRIPCRLETIDDRGVHFATPILDATFVPHGEIKAWDRRAGSEPRDLDADKRMRLLTLPRMQRENPPTHLIESVRGDFLRGRLKSMDDRYLYMEVRLDTKQIRRSSVARIIWLNTPDSNPADRDEEDAAIGVDTSSRDLLLQAVCHNGIRLTFQPEHLADSNLQGTSSLLGTCRVAVADVDKLLFGSAINEAAEELPYSVWRLHPATDPRFVTEDGSPIPDAIAGIESALVGQPAPDFTLEFKEGGEFTLSQQKGRVVILDFWASWCGWCMKSMPDLDQMAQEFGDQITWVAVNLQEDHESIAAALERLGIEPQVVLDIDGAAAEKFRVTAIPQTVIIDAEGIVSRVYVGGGPNIIEDVRTGIRETLEGKKSNAEPEDESQ